MLSIDELLALEQVDETTFNSIQLWGAPATKNAFGGQLVALSLGAAFRTVPNNYIARSLHAQFFDCVDKTQPVTFKVEDNAPGSRVVSRTVRCFQGKRQTMQTVCTFLAQKAQDFQAEFKYQKEMPEAERPGSGSSPFLLDPQGYPNNFPAKIWVTELDSDHARPAPAQQTMWLESPDKNERPTQTWQCVVALYSDVHFTRVIVRPFGIRMAPPPRYLRKIVSIDHHVWFHEAVDARRPILVSTACAQLSRGRGVVQSEMFAHDQRLVATVVQEGRVEIDPHAPLPKPKL